MGHNRAMTGRTLTRKNPAFRGQLKVTFDVRPASYQGALGLPSRLAG